MKSILFALRRFAKDDDGVTAIEYGLIAALIAVVGLAGISDIGSAVATKFTSIATSLGVKP